MREAIGVAILPAASLGVATAALLVVAVSIFGIERVTSLEYADRLFLRIQVIERSQPPLR